VVYEDFSIIEKILSSLKSDKKMVALYEYQYSFLITSRSLLFRKRNILDKLCRENQNTHFVFSNVISENRAFYDIMWRNVVEPDTPQKAT
jgi:hypothetical protein